MLAAVLTAVLFATSAICGHRVAKRLGGVEANFWRIILAAIFLTAWALPLGDGLAGAPGWFALSGFFGIGIGDTAFFLALPRLGSRRAVLLTQCFTAPCAAVVEWLWLGSQLQIVEIGSIVLILTGVTIALKPDDHIKLSPHEWRMGIMASLVAALAGATGAVIIRKGYSALAAANLNIDAGTTGFQRILGGIIIPIIALLIIKWRFHQSSDAQTRAVLNPLSSKKRLSLWPWVLVNALAGQTLGVTCMQWALKTTPAGVVAAIIATTPLLLLPMTLYLEKEHIHRHSLVGGGIAVFGVISLILLH